MHRETKPLTAPGEPCPLCGEVGGTTRFEIEFAEIWRRLDMDWGARFSQATLDRHTPAPRTRLVECDSCGLQHFVPGTPGDQGFYEELMKSASFESKRWEFSIVESRLEPEESVVDLGCGDGAFIRLLGDRSGRVVGVDHNATAISRLTAEGFEAHTGDPASFAELEAQSFDVACGFQILEHLPDTAELMRPIRTLLRSPGRIFISVPDRNRAAKDDAAPFDCPPHHISRWSAEQMCTLADAYGLELVEVIRQPVDRSAAVVAALAPLEDRVGELPRLPRSAAIRIVRLMGLTRRRFEQRTSAGEFERRGIHGHTMLAEFAVR